MRLINWIPENEYQKSYQEKYRAENKENYNLYMKWYMKDARNVNANLLKKKASISHWRWVRKHRKLNTLLNLIRWNLQGREIKEYIIFSKEDLNYIKSMNLTIN
jgi:predicted RNase H-like nuclease